MMQRWTTPVAVAALLAVASCARAGDNLDQIANLVVAYGDTVISAPDAEQQLTNYDPDTGLVRDPGGRLNIAEDSLNYAAALLETGQNPERAAKVIQAVLQEQDTADGSATRGLFRWMHQTGGQYDVNATLYLAPALAHLTRELSDSGKVGETLRVRSALALQGLLAHPKTVTDGFAAMMWAGAVSVLGEAAGVPSGPEAGRALIGRWLQHVVHHGISDGNSPTFDALRIGGLRWAWQAAPDDDARRQVEVALQLCYRDLLQRYDPDCAVVGGAMVTAYPADYVGATGVPRYLLACDLPSALSALEAAEPLAMYFALSSYPLSDDLRALVTGRADPYELRTRIPADDPEQIEAGSTCTWVAPGHTLGTMSGEAGRWSIPIMFTCNLPHRPTSYWYLPDVAGHVQSVQSGPLALCSFTFDNIGLPGRTQVRVRGVLGAGSDVERVLINGVEWIREPAAVGESAVVALRRGDAYLAIKVLGCGYKGQASGGKPGILTVIGEGDERSVVLDLYGRQADYPLRKPLLNVRVSMLIETAPVSEWDSLESFARHVRPRRVKEEVKTLERRARELEQNDPLKHNEPKTKAEMVFIRSALHGLQLSDEQLPLGLVENMTDRVLVTRMLPQELPPTYLWLSPGLSLNVGGSS
ncbi:MAG: hypothetical protein J7M38_05415 [Armatimonadetes bacterium]|nr:hypothetical protein [Armatimonadota bacterium]